MLKIAIVSAWFPTKKSPVNGIFVEREAKALSKKFEVTVFHLAAPHLLSPSEQESSDFNIVRLEMSPKSLLQIAKARKKLKAELQKFDIIHTAAFPSLLPLSLPFGIKHTQPWIHTEHWSQFLHNTKLSDKIINYILGILLRKPDVVLAVSNRLKNNIDNWAHRTVQKFSNLVMSPPELKNLNFTSRPARLIFVGRLDRGKQPLLALETVSELTRRGERVTLQIVGEGPLYAEIKETARLLDIDDKVSFTGAILPDQVSSLLSKAQIFFVPTLFETFFLGCAEALSHGRPVVVGANGAHSEYINSKFGILVERQSPGAYADAIQNMLQRSQITAEEIQQSLETSMLPEGWLETITAIYNSAVKNKNN